MNSTEIARRRAIYVGPILSCSNYGRKGEFDSDTLTFYPDDGSSRFSVRREDVYLTPEDFTRHCPAPK